VEYVVVDEKHRRRGIGKLLMDDVIERAKEAGCYKIMLTSDNRREEAHDFYRSLGFEASAHGFRLYF
jgi:GNAT superfamily N-acetyltransferase